VDVVSSSAQRHAPDLSLNYTGPVPAPPQLFIDGDGSGVLLSPGGTPLVHLAAEQAEHERFDLLWTPGASDRLHGAAGDVLDTMLAELLGPDPERFLAAYRFDVRAPLDDRPFFNQFLRGGGRDGDLDFLSVSERGLLFLRALLLLLAAAVLLLVLGPLLPLRASLPRAPFNLLTYTGKRSPKFS